MTTQRIHPLMRLMPSLTDVAFLLPLVFLFGRMKGVETLLSDGDTGWHLRTGEWMLANGRVPGADLFSFTRAGEPWFAWEWLWDLVFAWAHRHGGLAAVVMINVVLLSVTFTLLFRLVRAKSNPVVAIVLTVLAIAASSVHWLARPHLVTLLLVVVWWAVLEQVRERRRYKLLAVLPGLMVLWTNVHGGFVAGGMLLAIYGAGELAGSLAAAGPGERRAALRRAGYYGIALAACIAATFCNPYTWRLHQHILAYLSDPFLMDRTNEFMSLSFHHPAAHWFEPALLVGAAAALWSLARRRFAHGMVVLVWAHLALLSGRNIPLYMAVSAPVIALCLVEWTECLRQAAIPLWMRGALDRFHTLCLETGETERIWRLHLASAAGILLVAAVVYAPAPPPAFRPAFSPGRFPVKAVEKLRPQIAGARVFTDMQWGDYLIYRLYPATRVFIDGRGDFYGADFCREFLDVMDVNHTWEARLNRYGVDTVLVPTGTALGAVLKESSRWRILYDDGHALVFQRASAPTVLDRDRAIANSQPGDPTIAKTKS